MRVDGNRSIHRAALNRSAASVVFSCVTLIYTLEGKLLRRIGTRGQHSDTGCEDWHNLPLRAAGPFNHPTEMMPGPSGDLYVTDGYRG